VTNAEVSAEFLDDDDAAVSTDVVDPDTAAEVRASLSLRDADRIEAWVRQRIASKIRENQYAMNSDVLAALIEAGRV
jgi:hypothetical protein